MGALDKTKIDFACPACGTNFDVLASDLMAPILCPGCKADLTEDSKLKEQISVMHFLTDGIE